MSTFVLIHPEALALLLLVPLALLAARRLTILAPWRRQGAAVVQSLSILGLVLALAEPVRLAPGPTLNLVLVLDASDSLSLESRQQVLDYVRAVLANAGPTDRVQVVATARTASVLTADDVTRGAWRTAPAGTLATDENAGASNLAAGLRLAGSLLPDVGQRRVVLLSDGWETQGEAAAEAAGLSARGVDLAVLGLPALGSPEVIVADLETPPYARVGDTITSQVHIHSTQASTGTLSIRVDGVPVSSLTVALVAGDNVIPLEQHATATGFHSVALTLEVGQDTNPTNNTTTSTLVVKPAPHVLMLEDRGGEAAALATALESQQITVDVRPPSTIPPQVQGLDEYDTVILNNVAATSLTLDQQRTIQEYVRRNGRGLVVVGGPTSYAKGDYADSVLEDALPLSSQPSPRPRKGAIALILIVDHSASMLERTVESGVNKLAMAKEAARLAVDTLRDGDSLGVLSFDTGMEWTLPIQPINGEADKQKAKTAISNIAPGSGTSILPALREAAAAIMPLLAPSKHLVLLTDGREYGLPDYDNVLAQIRKDDVHLTTIGVGAQVDRELLTRLAKQGEGRFYFTERATTLPKLLIKELDLSLKEALAEGPVLPHFVTPSPLLRDFTEADLPQLGGYDITTAKDEAVVALGATADDPLLAHWNYGLGRVVAFASGAGPGWAAGWMAWDGFARFWAGTVRWAMASPVTRQLQPTITLGDAAPGTGAGVAHLSVESLRADNSFADLATLTAALRTPAGAVTTTLLTQTAPGRYEADVLLGEPGAYEVRLSRQGPVGTPAEPVTETAGFSLAADAEGRHAGINDRLLQRLAGGHPYLTSAAQALDRHSLPATTPDRQALWPVFLAPALLLLLAGVAVRRLDFRLRR